MNASSAVFLAIFVIATILPHSIAEPVEDKRALLDFAKSLPHGRVLNWKGNSTVCNNWVGVNCSSDHRRIIGVHLPGIGLNGSIAPNTLGRLSALRSLNLRSNGMTGPFPSDLIKIKSLTVLHLQFNNFSDSLPTNISLWKNLTVIDLSFNAFSGSIPSSISNLSQLVSLNLSNNLFSGDIPDLHLPKLKQLHLANNSLRGSIPKSLRSFPSSSFVGNNLSIISPPHSVSPWPSPLASPPINRSKNKKLGQSAILGIVVGGCVVVFVVLALLFIARYSNWKRGSGSSSKIGKRNGSPDKIVGGSQDENNRIVFFEGCRYAFDLEDLLRASAEVLGKGTFGTAYKAVLEDATTVVVKRLKEIGAGQREFEQLMEVVGRMKHENVVELRAYYYSKDEKLMVYDYYSQGSVSALLHGKRGENRTPFDWDTRLNIALGVARGVAYIHLQSSGKFVHGNIKASNVFLNSDNYGCVSDIGLTNLTSNIPVPFSRAAGYRAPELVDARKASQASDVYSVGVVLLELLTGKSPVESSGGDEIVHLVRWVQSVVREEWTAEVFDVELMRYPNIEEELVEMLQIAMSCVVRMPEQRPIMAEVVKMIEDVRRVDTVDRPSDDGKSEDIGSGES